MKKVLFVCLCFAPDNSVAAIRPTKIAKYLHESGEYEIDVLKLQSYGLITDELLVEDLKHIHQVYEVPQVNYNTTGVYSSPNEGFFGVLKRKCRSLSEHMLEWRFDRKNFNLAKKYMKEYMRGKHYDIIFSSSGPFLTHKIAAQMKKHSKDSFWIADYRDPLPNTLAAGALIRAISRQRVRYITRNANLITGATAGCYENMKTYAPERCIEITNGYDTDDLAGFVQTAQETDKLTFCYTGTIHKQKSDLSMVFRALEELIQEGIVQKDRILFRYAGRMERSFRAQAAQFHLADTVESYGYVTRKQSIALQMQSDILLLASFNYTHQNDVITGKFFEYLMSAKPIICTIKGNAPGSRLKHLIDSMRCGVCCEEAAGEADFLRLKAYVKEQYTYFCQQGTVIYDADKAAVEAYHYRNIVKKLCEAIQQIQAT